MNVKKGDLAILVNCILSENLGKICEVKNFLGEMSFKESSHPHPNCWHVHFPSGVRTGDHTKLYHCWIPDAWLRPVKGIPDESDTKTYCNYWIAETA